MEKSSHIPVDNIRFASMISIIFLHSFCFGYSADNEMYLFDYLRIIVSDILKYGTLCFFLISGYLIGVKLDDYSSGEFFVRRMKLVAKPWFFWSIFLVLASILISIVKSKSWGLMNILADVYFRTEYWFVLNYFVALAVLILLRGLCSNISGIIFMFVSLFYSVNIYVKIIPVVHTAAIFGFVFYLWFGLEVRRGGNRWVEFIMGLDRNILLLLAIFSYILSVLESIVIKKYFGVDPLEGVYSNDPVNTLRISNQIYGLLIFALLFRIKKTIYPRWIYPRDETFGLYLVHWPVLLILTAIMTRVMALYFNVPRFEFINNVNAYLNGCVMLAVCFLLFFILYFSSLAFVKILRSSPFSWVVGKI